MRDFLRSRRFKILLVIFAVLMGLMIYEVANGDQATVPGNIVSVIVTPFQKLSSAISTSVSDFLGHFADSAKNYKENEKLKNENAALQQKLVEYEKLKDQVEQLKELAGVQDLSEDYKGVGATVIARDATEQYFSFILDKGSRHGVSTYDPVVTQRGLVGMVTKVYPTSCQVVTILSPDLFVGALELRTGETGSVSGSIDLVEAGKCQLQYLQRETGITKGDVISTSGAGGRFPQGYVVGIVEDVQQKSDGKTAYAIIRPSEDIQDVNNVCILIDFDGKGIQTGKGEETVSSDTASGETASGATSSKK